MDVVKGIRELVRGDWSGDVDLNDGAVNTSFQEYHGVLRETAQIGLGQRRQSTAITEDLTAAMENLKDHITFIRQSKLLKVMITVNTSVHTLLLELSILNTAYEEKLSTGHFPEKSMLELLWNINTLKQLYSEGSVYISTVVLAQISSSDSTTVDMFDLTFFI